MRKNEGEKTAHWAKAIDCYFSFHKHHFRDNEGYALAPDWNGVKRGMELKSLKLLLETLRSISEGKKNEWTEERMISDFNAFMEKSMNHNLVKKDFRVAMLNRFKIEILSSSYNPVLSKKILEAWYVTMPNYSRVYEKDKEAAELIAAYLKEQYLLASIEFTEQSVLSTCLLIFKKVKESDFWSVKPLLSIAKNIQEFINKIKNGNNNSRGTEQVKATIKQRGSFGQL